MKKKLLIKILALALALAAVLPLMLACKDDGDGEGFNPYPYDDLSVYMDLPEYKNFTVSRADVNRFVNAELMAFCQEKGLTQTLTEGTAQMYDYVYIAYNGMIDGQTFDGGVSDGYSLLLGSGSFIEGFEDGCVGMSVGEEKYLNLKFPDDYGYTQYAGKDVVFRVELKSIERMPRLTDEQCAQYSVYENKEQFMAALEEHCVFDYMWQTLMSKCTLKGYPNKEYTEYYSYFEGFFKDEAELRGISFEKLLSDYGSYYAAYGLWRGMTVTEFRQVADNYAKSNLINDLLTYSVMRAENIAIEGAEWDAAVKIFENEYGKEYAQIVEEAGETATIISVLMIRISNIMYGYVTITE